MTHAIGHPTKVLAIVDDEEAQTAVLSAAALAEKHGAALEVLACVEPPSDLAILAKLSGRDPDQLIAEAVERTRADMSARLAGTLPDQALSVQVVVGKTFFEIIGHVIETGCDFVIKKAEPLSGVSRFLFASTDQHLLRKCPCPVWLQTPGAPVTPKRVLATIDLDVSDAAEPNTLTDLNRRVIDVACGIAQAPDAEVVVLHVWEAIGEGMVWAYSGGDAGRAASDKYVNEILSLRQNAMQRFMESLDDNGVSRPRIVPILARGAPEQVIEEQRRELGADVVVMGTVARTGLSGVFIGNTAENIINTLECPVLAVKPEGFVSPLASA